MALACAVVLSYNNLADTDECLRSLASQDYAGLRLVVVDNGSEDGSAERLREAWEPGATFVATGRNLGVAGGYNAGMRAALAMGADYVVLCNNDIVAEAGFVSALAAVLEAEPETAAVTPLIVYHARPDRVWFAGVRQVPLLHLCLNRGRGGSVAAVRRRLPEVSDSAYVVTCATMLRRRAIESVGLLDERFFFGHDDVDWCLRAWRLGLASRLLARPMVRHKVSVTSGVRGSDVLRPAAAYTHATGSVLIGAKHYRNLAMVPFLLGLLAVRAPLIVLRSALAGSWRSIPSYLRGLWDGFRLYGREAFGPPPRASGTGGA